MKIFYPLEVFYPSQAGGPANSIYWLTKNLVKEGFEPIIVASDKGVDRNYPLNRWSRNEAGEVIHVRTRSLTFPVGQTVRSLLNFYRADVVHISSFFYPAAFITAFAARALKKKIIWSARGELDTAALEYSKLKKSLVLWSIKRFIGRYPLFHSTCDAETTYIGDAFGEGAAVVQVPNFIEIPGEVERSDGKYILFLGRIHWKKGIENLLTAISMTKEFLELDLVLKIAGRGAPGYEAELRKIVSDLNLTEKIQFVGQVEGDEKQKLLADAFWTIMPSHTENFGLVVLESLAQNTPVIASKGSPWEALETEKLGFWVDNSPEELSRTLRRIVTMEATEYEDYRRRGRAFVSENFDIGRNIQKWVEIYRGLI
jgi:glycosyltransferase involved in cell wall biosynthesis